MFRKITDIHIFDHRNFYFIDCLASFRQSLVNDTTSDMKFMFIMGAAGCTVVLFIIIFSMFVLIKRNIFAFRKLLILIPYNKRKEENSVYLIKKLDEY